MACYSDKYKHTCSKIVMAVSALMGLMALISVIFGIIQLGAIPMTSEQKDVFQIPGMTSGAKGIGAGNIAIGIVGLLVACLGCLTGAKKNPCFAIPYGILTFIITIIFLVIGLIAGGISSPRGQKALFDAACGGAIVIPGQQGKTVNTNLDLSDQYKKYVDQPTCSLFCPCPDVAVLEKGTYPQTELYGWGRYMAKTSVKDNKYTTYPTSSKISEDNLVQLQYAGKGDSTFPKTYSSYKLCFNDVLMKTPAKTGTTPAQKQAAKTREKLTAFIKGNGFGILEDFEKKYDCAGFCKTPLFYATREVTQRPAQECIKPIVKSFSKVAGMVSVVAFISFLANFCGFCGSFALCTKMEGNDDDK